MVSENTTSRMGSANYLCRVMKYREPEIGEKKMAFVPHIDKSFMSTIHQNNVAGLEIKAKDGEWFGLPGLTFSSVVVMAGDAIMAWTNDRIKSPIHRVTMEGSEARYTLAQFSVMEKDMGEDHPLRYKPFDHLKFLDFFSQEENRMLESPIHTYCGV
ncbi:hypothetical protein AAHA92_19293 [Salvia divinorum]|uniref:Fe2OG dioxygenase domain-containing protein n=1 Tax=Salvia divinorum TaxID=28513 RepID=A0ABD1H4U3_SALDI